MINPLSSCEFLLKLARNNYCQKSTAILTQDATEHCKRENHSHQSSTTNQAETRPIGLIDAIELEFYGP